MEGELLVPQETIDAVKKSGKRVHIGFTRDAVEKFNMLKKDGKKAVGIFHSTC